MHPKHFTLQLQKLAPLHYVSSTRYSWFVSFSKIIKTKRMRNKRMK